MTSNILLMTTQIKTDMSLYERIKTVLSADDTTNDITEKIISEYPKLFELKIEQRGNDKDARSQLKGEISSRLNQNEGTVFTINRNSKPYTYSLVSEVIDEDEDEDEIIEIKTETELDIGYVYIIDTHLLTKNGKIYKIGKANDINKRIDQLNREQGSYEKHTVLYSFKVERPFKVEHAIHNMMDKARINPKKEGFYGEYVESNIDLIKSMVKLFECE